MTPEKQSYITSGLQLLRDQLNSSSPEAAASVAFTDPRFTLVSAPVKVDFSFTPNFSTHPAASPKPSHTDLSDQEAADSALKSIFAAALPKLSATPPFEVSAGPFLLDRVPRTVGEPSFVHYRQVCQACSGKKLVRCKPCRGQGSHTCSTCDGRRDTDCSECRGSGRTTSFSGELVTCGRCSGSRRLPCDVCSRTGSITCNVCKGKRAVSCKPCSGFGQVRYSRSMTVSCSVSTNLGQCKPSCAFLPDILDAFGGLPSLQRQVGTVSSTSSKPGYVSYSIDVPVLSVSASFGPHKSFCVVAGLHPRLVQTGDFLEKALSTSFDSLDQLLRSTNSVTCNPVAIRTALLQFLDSGAHRACINPSSPQLPGITNAYAVSVRRLVHAATTQLRHNTIFRFLAAGSLLAPIIYIAAHRIFSLHPLDAVSAAIVPPAMAYACALFSMNVTLRSLGLTRDSVRYVSSFAPLSPG